jgi:hypothetical protein
MIPETSEISLAMSQNGRLSGKARRSVSASAPGGARGLPMGELCHRLHAQLEDIETAHEPVDGVEDAAVVHEHIVELDRFGR